MKNKILIIKTGYTEILDKEQDSRKVSFGDILRTTPLLHKYKDDHVTWITSDQAFPLLINNPHITRLLHLDFINALQLESEEFDKVINLEKVPGICALSDKIRARRSRYGFTFNSQKGEAEALDKAYEVLAVCFNLENKKSNKRFFQDLLFETVGEKFDNEEYVLGYKPQTKETYDIGFNTEVGSKWPSKKWPVKNWDKLESILKKDFSISRQDKQNNDVLTNLYSYIDWINSCKTIISNDSLGLHLSLSLGKNTFGLFGPTSSEEIYFYNRGKAILPENLDCIRCFEPNCKNQYFCMDLISPEKVAGEVREYLNKNQPIFPLTPHDS